MGVGVGGAALILALVATIFFRRRSARNLEKFEGEARARWEAEYHAGRTTEYYNQPQQGQKERVAELSAPNYVAEADEGRPQNPELPSEEPTSRSPSNTLLNSSHGIPAVPENHVTRDSAR